MRGGKKICIGILTFLIRYFKIHRQNLLMKFVPLNSARGSSRLLKRKLPV